MSSNKSVNICVLWQHEVKLASALVAEFTAKCKDKSVPVEKISELAVLALNACHVALHGADTATHVMVCNATDQIAVPKKTAAAVKKAGGGA